MDEDGIEIDRAILRALLKGLIKNYVRFYCDLFGLLTKLVRSRWLDIRQILFFACIRTETDRRSS